MSYPFISLLHVATAIIAMVTGLLLVLATKGARRHKQVGYAYVASMLALNLSSLFIFSLTGRLSPFHVAALFSLATVRAGFAPVFFRKPSDGWLDMHLQFMAWSCFGLLAAAAAEIAVRIPESRFWWAVIVSSAVIIIAGAFLVTHHRPKLLERYGRFQRG